MKNQYSVNFKPKPHLLIRNPVWNPKSHSFEFGNQKCFSKKQAQIIFNSVLIAIRQNPEYKDASVTLWQEFENREAEVVLRGTFDS